LQGLVAEDEVFGDLRTAQVEIPVLQAQGVGNFDLFVQRKGGVSLVLRMRSSSAKTSMAPVCSLGFSMAAGRLTTLPRTAMTHSLRN
jgi:hypothetical protein